MPLWPLRVCGCMFVPGSVAVWCTSAVCGVTCVLIQQGRLEAVERDCAKRLLDGLTVTQRVQRDLSAALARAQEAEAHETEAR